jgi:hypothetical protein
MNLPFFMVLILRVLKGLVGQALTNPQSDRLKTFLNRMSLAQV